ncbi:tubulin polyglutamylase TTLL7-like isoform X3 [Babylonia areolata]|uniref:tubulin polyglutamylase TTLL7-like isoform X3 n=1 Tax=Babylonia areolata TaxID=304850 RepID=UPI003FD65610
MSGLRQSMSLTSLSSMDRDLSLASLTHIPPSRRSSIAALQAQRALEERKMRGIELSVDELAKHDPKPAQPNAKKKKRRKHNISANLSGTRYDVVRQMAEKVGFTIARDDDPSSYLIWSDCFVSTDRVAELKPFQRLNHFPGMGEISRKDCLARNILKMQKSFPEEYSFIPRTWILPADYGLLQNHAKDMRAKKKFKTFIVKPANGAQGHGISLFRSAEKIPPSEHFIVQEYIDKPLLLDGYKFDLRVYVLITSCDPLRVFLFNDGLVRLATEKYMPPQENNISHLYMHLTNYSVNKHNAFYERDTGTDSGSKRSIRYFNEYLRHNDIDVALLWRNIADMITKTLIVGEPHLLHAYRMCRPGVPSHSDSVCFEVLGFDVMIDRKLRPWLIEINRSPSFGTDEKLDFDIKSALIEDTFRLLNIKASDKRRNIAAQKAEAQKRLFRSHKKVDLGDMSEMEKKKQSVEKRKEELKDLLTKIRKASTREDYENRNCGRFRRIFPCDDRARHAKYCTMLGTSFGLFLSGRGATLQKEIEVNYNNKLREDDVLDMLAECEAEEREGKMFIGGPQSRTQRGPKPLQSMPESLRPADPDEEEEDELSEEDTTPATPMLNSHVRSARSATRVVPSAQRPSSQRSTSDMSCPPSGSTTLRNPNRPQSHVSGAPAQRSRSLTRTSNVSNNSKPAAQSRSAVDDNFLSSMVKEREEELTKKTLSSLNEMRIKFPGKTDTEAELLLDRLNENWKFHKPRIASYWLVKLDSIKRRKVVDIVRSNVKAVLQRIWRSSDVDNLRLCRIFSRVFNRLLWSHGQGLWNCFSPSTGVALWDRNSWETIFSRSTELVSETEMNCCRRIVQLCRDCLLIVYQFAAEAKSGSAPGVPPSDHGEDGPAPQGRSNGECYLVQGIHVPSGPRLERPPEPVEPTHLQPALQQNLLKPRSGFRFLTHSQIRKPSYHLSTLSPSSGHRS